MMMIVDIQMLTGLIAQRINISKFHVHAPDDVMWPHAEDDTPENRAIVADVIANYDALAVAYLAEQKILKENAVVKATLEQIDVASVRSIREWLAAQPSAPAFLGDHEAAARIERAKLK